MSAAPMAGGVAIALLLAGCAAVPVAPAAPALPTVALRNPGFESAPRVGERCAEHWSCTMHADPSSFRFVLEGAGAGAGQRSLCIERVTKEPWALLTQGIDHEPLRGRRLRLSMAVRAEGIDGRGAGPWVLVQGVPVAQGHFERLAARTDGWQRLSVDFVVEPAATLVEVGAVLEGGGRACFDDARLELLGPP
jgi:hypothetical protein